MINRKAFDERRYELRREAANRWIRHAPEVAAAAERLAQVGPLGSASPRQRARYESREAAKVALRGGGYGFERMIGPTLDFDDRPTTDSAFEAGKPVARIVELLDRDRIGEGFATGFLVGGGLFMTNWHVFANPGDADGCGAQFGYQRVDSGLIDPGTVYELDPALFFHSDKALDIALVGIKRTPAIGAQALASYKSVRLIPTVGKILVGQPVSIIQHPEGSHKRWAVRENKLVREPGDADLFIEYTTDTLPGSSGSPAFNTDWELIAIHHSGVPRLQGTDIVLKDGRLWTPGTPDSEIDWVANEGARVSKIHGHLATLQLAGSGQQLLDGLLANATDPVIESRVDSAGPLATDRGSASGVALPGPVHVVVHGTANFYVGYVPPASGPALAPIPAAAPVPRAPIGTVEKKLKFDSKYGQRPGYKPGFLDGFNVPVPEAPLDEVIKQGGRQKILRYHHYSLVMHKDRRLCIWAASNIDYDKSKRWRTREEFGTDTWKLDPRLPGENQIDDVELYDPAKKFDQGHIVRRDDVAWGETREEEEFGNSDSFHFTNCTPQHEEFNRAMFQFKGLWGELEKHITKQAGFLNDRLIVFAGPVLAARDPKRDFGLGANIQIPIKFWKVIIAVEDADTAPRLRAYGFVLNQKDAIDEYGWENRFRAGKFSEQQVSLAELTELTRVQFSPIVVAADSMGAEPTETRRRTLRTLDDVKLR